MKQYNYGRREAHPFSNPRSLLERRVHLSPPSSMTSYSGRFPKPSATIGNPRILPPPLFIRMPWTLKSSELLHPHIFEIWRNTRKYAENEEICKKCEWERGRHVVFTELLPYLRVVMCRTWKSSKLPCEVLHYTMAVCELSYMLWNLERFRALPSM